MPATSSRSPALSVDEELRLPRAPGVIRQFWARHPLFADILIAVVCLLVTTVPAATLDTAAAPSGSPQSIAASITVPVLVVAACILLVWRRRWPLLTFAASQVVALTYLFVPLTAGGPLILVTTYTLAVYRSARACWTALGIGIVALILLAFVSSGIGFVSWSDAVNAIISEFVVGLIGALIGINVGNRKRYMTAVLERSRQLLVERDQQAQLAAAAERARIAREMHDIVSHSLTVVVALSEGALATDDPARARGAMDAAAQTARTALDEMRTMLGVLRADEGGDALLTPMEPVEPRDAVLAAQRAGFPVTLIVSGKGEAPTAVRFALGRVVQEGVTNAIRHAPTAREIRLRVDYDTDHVSVEIANDGVDAQRNASHPAGFGLRGLTERVSHVGGTVQSGPAGAGRWLLTATLPHQTSAKESTPA